MVRSNKPTGEHSEMKRPAPNQTRNAHRDLCRTFRKTIMATIKKPTFKEGQKVTHAKFGTGKIKLVRTLANGIWLTVDFGDKKTTRLKSVRPGTLVKA